MKIAVEIEIEIEKYEAIFLQVIRTGYVRRNATGSYSAQGGITVGSATFDKFIVFGLVTKLTDDGITWVLNKAGYEMAIKVEKFASA